MSAINSPKSTKITTAVEFLGDVHSKGYSETILKKYLIEKRGLTAKEVEVAFLINKNRLEAAAKENQGKASKKDRERPEKPASLPSRSQNDVTFLLPSKQTAGAQLINQFLDAEKTYCNILQCLEKEYHSKLARYAYLNRFQMSRKEVEEIFLRIPDLLKFHSGFFLDLKRGSNIGRIFVQLFKFFEGYAEYMKDCQQTVNKMRKYIQDTRLQTCMLKIGEDSTRRNDDMVDLLLYPLDRILHYRDFLNILFNWADKTQTSDYDLLGKASRRISRVSAYIEKYKYGICNQNEMNKVQKFLSNQCDILAPERAIVRRGVMTRRTTGVLGRNKHYVFFLFNDMLLWTTKNGALQNALQLRSCEVMPSSAKNFAPRKFEVVYRSEKHKTLRLECETVSERNNWYEALRKTITTAKVKYSEAWSRSESLVSTKYNAYSDNLSDDDSKVLEPSDVSKGKDDDSRVEPPEQLQDPYNKRYTVTSSFRIQEFKEIDPMGDNVSQVSEQDVAFHEERRNYLAEDSNTGSACLSPFEKAGSKQAGEAGDRVIVMESPDNSNLHDRSASVVLLRKSPSTKQSENKEDGCKSSDRGKKSSIVRRSGNKSPSASQSPPERFTIRLDGF